MRLSLVALTLLAAAALGCNTFTTIPRRLYCDGVSGGERVEFRGDFPDGPDVLPTQSSAVTREACQTWADARTAQGYPTVLVGSRYYW